MQSFTIRHVKECKSTMDLDYPPWTAVYADMQTNSRGTKGRSWVSQPGNLLCTFFMPIRPDLLPNFLCLRVGVHVAEALTSCGGKVKLRWPNDLVSDGKKVGGILITSESGVVKIGIGVNLVTAPRVDQGTACLSSVDASCSELVERIGKRLANCSMSNETVIQRWGMLAEWKENKYGKPIRITKQGHLMAKSSTNGQVRIIKNIV